MASMEGASGSTMDNAGGGGAVGARGASQALPSRGDDGKWSRMRFDDDKQALLRESSGSAKGGTRRVRVLKSDQYAELMDTDDLDGPDSPGPDDQEVMCSESSEGFMVVEERNAEEGCSLSESIFNLANTIVGAGVMALPRIVSELGLALGLFAIGAGAFISIFCLEALIWVSDTTRQTVSYGALVESQFGRWGGRSMQLAIIVNNFGIMIVYLIIASDVLVGGADIRGVLPVLFGTPGGDAAPWYLSKLVVLSVVTCSVLVPLVALKSMRNLASTSTVSIAIAMCFAVTTGALGLTALTEGKEADVRLFPDAAMLGGTALRGFRTVVQAMPVVLTAYNCHFNIHSIMGEMRNYSKERTGVVVRVAVLICGAMYMVVGAGAYMVFGSNIKADVLASFGRENLERLLGGTGSVVVATIVKLLYVASLMVTYPLINWALRVNAFELAWNTTPDPGSPVWYTLTYVLLGSGLLLAITIPSIWVAIELTGATAGVLISFFWPMVLLLKVKRDKGSLPWGTTLAAAGVLVLGLTVTVVGVWESVSAMVGGADG